MNCASADIGYITTHQGAKHMPSWAGLWDGVYAQPYAPLNEPTATERDIARSLAPAAEIGLGALAAQLSGQAPGGTATASYTQRTAVQADGPNQGGLVPISTKSVINRATTAADETRMDTVMFKPVFAPLVYPVDKSGNGGGG